MLFLIIFLASFLSLRFLFLKKDVDNTLPEVKLNSIIDKEKAMAIMVSNDGSYYQEYTEDIWPGDNYKFKEAKCIDNNGSLVDENIISFENDKVVLETNQTVYCTLYFDKKIIIDILRENDPNKVLSSEEVGGMYRYQGLDKQYKNDSVNNPNKLNIVDNNYICFGTDDKNACLKDETKYMYRIIGVTKSAELKLIKETFLKEGGSVITPQWNDKYTLSSPYDGVNGDCDEDKCEWPNVMLYKRLNGISSGTIKGNDGNSNIFVNSNEYDYMQKDSNWYNIIEDHSWLYGDVVSTASYNGDAMYQIETGQVATTRYWPKLNSKTTTEESYTWNKKKSAKIGLQYLSDYYYAYPGGNPSAGTNAIKSWIYFVNNKNNKYDSNANSTSDDLNNYEWFLTRYGSNRNDLLIQTRCTSSDALLYGWNVSFHSAIRPTFYLSNAIEISGTGTIDNPYIVK